MANPWPEPRRRAVLWLAAAAGLPGGLPAAPAADPNAAALQRVATQLRGLYLATLPAIDAARHVQRQLASGLWPDVDYADQGVASWRALAHLERLRNIAVALESGDRGAPERKAALAAVVSGLEAWLAMKPVSENWWQTTVGQPMALAPTLVLLQDHLPAALVRRAAELFADPNNVPADRLTGQNLVWYASLQLARGALLAHAPDVQQASRLLQATMQVTASEGIQPDYSFHQHDAQLYSAGYGLGFLQDLTRMAQVVDDTPWAFAAPNLALLADYGLQGVCPLVRGTWMDWGARGREFTRHERQPRTQLLAPTLKALAGVVPERAPALSAAAAAVAAGRIWPEVLRNRLYWRSDFLVHQTKAGYVSVKACSARTVGTESGNGENLLGYWLPFGVTYLLRRGDEYDGMPALWDWSALPGLTAPATTPAFAGYQRHEEAFVGGVSDTVSGAFVLRLNKLQTQARKFWSIDGDWVVALGSGIQSTNANPVRTTLNQCRRVGDVLTGQGVVQPGTRLLAAADKGWVWHDDMLYHVLDAEECSLALQQRREDGSRINRSMGQAQAQGDTFMLTIQHGQGPRGARYAYAVRLGATRADALAGASLPVVVANTPDLQAVRHPGSGLVHAVFHGPGLLELDGGDSLEADAGLVVQARRAGAAWELTVCEPTRRLPRAKVRLLRGGKTVAQTELPLPADPMKSPVVAWRAGA